MCIRDRYKDEAGCWAGLGGTRRMLCVTGPQIWFRRHPRPNLAQGSWVQRARPQVTGPARPCDRQRLGQRAQGTVLRRAPCQERNRQDPRNPTAYYLASTLLAYRRLRPKSVHTCSCRCEHKGFAVSTQLLRLHLPVKCEQRILNQRSP